MYSNNILNFQESTLILNGCTKKVWKLIEGTTYLIDLFVNSELFIEILSWALKHSKLNLKRLFKIFLKVCSYITYDMDFRFVPSDPVCFGKLSQFD